MNKFSVLFSLFFILTLFNSEMSAQLKNPKNLPYEWSVTDTSKKIVNLSEIQMVLPRHSFPPIDYPAFLNKKEGLLSFYKDEPVIAVTINDLAKAYPLNMLTMHEISNDTLAGIPILPTYCPLCNASMVYDRRLIINGKEEILEFEVSGMLRNSDMIMADKQTESWWQQFMGQAIVGELTNTELTIIPSQVISVENFFKRYPKGQILSPKTGKNEERYGKNPYVGYDNIENTPYDRFYNSDSIDSRLPPMERVLDIKGNDGYKIYPYSVLSKKGVINDVYDGENYVIFYKKGMVSVLDAQEISQSRSVGSSSVFSASLEGVMLTFTKNNKQFNDKETESTWDITGLCTSGELKGKQLTPVNHSNHFAFAILEFFPNALIYGQEKDVISK